MTNDTRYCSTRPIILPYKDHPTIRTAMPGLLLRPFRDEDAVALHELRSQIEVMMWTSKLTTDTDLSVTRTWMERFMDKKTAQPHLTDVTEPTAIATVEHKDDPKFNFVLVYNPDSADDTPHHDADNVIGAIGCHSTEPAEVGYMIRKEYWGRGIVTKALQSFVAAWWGLTRETVPLSVEQAEEAQKRGAQLISDDHTGVTCITEVLKAALAEENIGSRRVLEKCGFQYHDRYTLLEHGKDVVISEYILTRPPN